jgi:hypothetical protein
MGSLPNPIAASRETRAYAELREQIYRHPQLWTENVLSQHHPPRFSFLTHAKNLAAIIAAAGFVFWLWFGPSTNHAPEPSYPYYDTQKPVPVWSEPMPLKGNYGR